MAGTPPRRWKALLLIASVIGMTLAVAITAFPVEESWHVPRWAAGDTIEVTIGPDQERPTHRSTLRLAGPVTVSDERGVPRQGYYWEDLERGGPAEPQRYWDLSRGRGLQIYGPSGSPWAGHPELQVVWFEPSGAGGRGVALQGLVLKPGLHLSQASPDGTLTSYTVQTVGRDQLVVHGERHQDRYVPPLYMDEEQRGVRTTYEFTYTDRGSPYPAEVQIYIQAGDEARQHVNTITIEAVSLATGPRENTRTASQETIPPEDPRYMYGPWPQSLRPLGGIDGEIDLPHVLREASDDEGLQQYLDAHPEAQLVDLRYFRMERQDKPGEARVWHLQWASPADGKWYGFVRVKHIAEPSPIPLLFEESLPEDRFLDWTTGPFRSPLSADDIGPIESVEPYYALAGYRWLHPDNPAPLGFRWTRLILQYDDDLVLTDRAVGFGDGSAVGATTGKLAFRIEGDGRDTPYSSHLTDVSLRTTWMDGTSGSWIQGYLPATR